MKSKFKDMDILRLIENQHNMTKGGLYCANQIFEYNTDIPVIETVDDYGLVVSLYETSFEATDVVLDFSGTKVSEEEATFIVENKIADCYSTEHMWFSVVSDTNVSYFVGGEFITTYNIIKSYRKLCWF